MSLRAALLATLSKRKVSQIRFRKYCTHSDLRFPIEIWECITDFLSQTGESLFPLLVVHRGLTYSIERVLYRHINLSGDHLLHFTRRINLFERLANHPKLAQLVVSLVAPPLRIRNRRSATLSNEELARYCSSLHRALGCLPHLRSLSVSAATTNQVWGEPSNPHNEIFQGCNFQLRQLRIGGYYEWKTVRRMEAQYLIEELAVQDTLDRMFYGAAFPNLRILEVASSRGDSPRLLFHGNRPVQAVYWKSWKPILNRGPFFNVRSLRLNFVRIDIPILGVAFPSLCYLRLDQIEETVRALALLYIPTFNLINLI